MAVGFFAFTSFST